MKIYLFAMNLVMSITLFLNSCTVQATHTERVPHPRLAVVSRGFSNILEINTCTAHGIAGIVEEYTRDDSVLEASCKKYYACSSNISLIEGGSVVIFDEHGVELSKIKIGYIKAITFTPDAAAIIIMHRRTSDHHTVIQAYSMEGDQGFSQKTAYFYCQSLPTASTQMGRWPNIDDVPVKKFHVDHDETLRIELENPVNVDNKPVSELSDKQFMLMLTIMCFPNKHIIVTGNNKRKRPTDT